MTNQPLDLALVRQRLREQGDSKSFWRSLDELADTEEFRALVHRHLPRHMIASFSTNRRDFFKLMGAALAMAGLAGCNDAGEQQVNTIMPYVIGPEENVQGKPLFYATAMELGGYGLGVLAENYMGRPIKVEGNQQHPASLGGSNPFIQGSIYSLYDPDRAQVITARGQISTWDLFLAAIGPKAEELSANGGAGLHILTETVTSPTLAAQLQQFQTQFPQAQWHQYDPVNLDNVREGTRLALGRVLNPVYHFDQASHILTLDADFLYTLPGSLAYARQFTNRRRIWDDPAAAPTPTMNRLYAVESSPTITGAKADHRLPLRATAIVGFALAVAQALGVDVSGATAPTFSDAETAWINNLVADLQQAGSGSLVIAGENQPPAVHALAYAINAALGSLGVTVSFTEPVEFNPVNQLTSLRELVDAMAAGQVDTLLIIDCNPVYTAPVELNFAEHLAAINFTVQASAYFDETAALCQWHIPTSHFLEAWSDTRAFDGTATIIQPLIAPLFNSKTRHEVLGALLGEGAQRSAYEYVRTYWDGYFEGLAQKPQANTEAFWQVCLHDGVVPNSTLPAVEVSVDPTLGGALGNMAAPATEGLELIFRPDSSVWDGRFASNLWLQELPKHISTLTWDNAALISPATAERLAFTQGSMAELSFGERTLAAAVFILPGHPDETVTLTLGYGRTIRGRLAEGLGFNAYTLRTSDTFNFGAGLELRKLDGQYPLANTQNHYFMEGRDHVRVGTLAQYVEDPHFVAHNEAHGAQVESVGPEGAGESEITLPSLYPEYEYNGLAWAMVIDNEACIGCNACMIACQVENNIPVVGKEEVLRGREMHWIKVDTYFSGDDLENPETYFQPRPCMHCEKAPCEVVCPVGATLHDDEGLNQMVYNRCVGTKYCSNNCPYKVRRFNFFNYNDGEMNNLAMEIPLIQMARNPEVTVRGLGVMEKCTYCVQRIQYARIEAAKEDDRPIADGEVLTACQEACPTRAIIFGNMNDETSLVAKLKHQPRNYGLLAELGTQPRTTYLTALKNPNPALDA